MSAPACSISANTSWVWMPLAMLAAVSSQRAARPASLTRMVEREVRPPSVHGAQAIGCALAHVCDQRVEAARGVGEILQPAVIDARVGAQREIECGIDGGVTRCRRSGGARRCARAHLRPACTCTRG